MSSKQQVFSIFYSISFINFTFKGVELDTGFIARHEHKLIPELRKPTLAEVASAAMAFTFKPKLNASDPFDVLSSFRVNQGKGFFNSWITYKYLQRLKYQEILQ